MPKPIYKISKEVQVGIYDSKYTANIYKDKIIVVLPYVNWVNNTGHYAEAKESIRDQKVVNQVIEELQDDCEDTAWGLIGQSLDNDYLMANPYH